MNPPLDPNTFTTPRSDWTHKQVSALFDVPLLELVHVAHAVHRDHFPEAEVQLATLLSIKTGGCPEDCAYCPQSVHHGAEVDAHKLLDKAAVLDAARRAQASGATRFCMGAAWRSPRDNDLERVAEIVSEVKSLGLETCVTLGMLTAAQARRLAEAGLDYYNHNLDTSAGFYGQIISTRTYESRLETLANVRDAGVSVCCGGIIGMGEGVTDRAALLTTLATLTPHPESVPVNLLVPVQGTPLADADSVPTLELVRMLAVARLVMPASTLRLSAGRTGLTPSDHALCFMAGANSIFYGDALLTTPNPDDAADLSLLNDLGLRVAGATA